MELSAEELERLEALAGKQERNRSIEIGRIIVFQRRIGGMTCFDEHGNRYKYKNLFWNVWIKPPCPTTTHLEMQFAWLAGKEIGGDTSINVIEAFERAAKELDLPTLPSEDAPD